jgi:hypothetical protein
MSIKKYISEMNLDPNNYIICGSDGFSRVYYDQPSLWNYQGIHYFKKCFPNNEFPNFSHTCLCGHYICENCYITTKDMDYKNILIIGNCCYKTYTNDIRTNCLICNEKHNNGISRNKGICDNCKNIIKDERKQIKSDSKAMFNKYSSYYKDSLKDLINSYNLIYNSIKLLNKIVKIKSNNVNITFVYNDKYSIANIYNNKQLIYRMNLLTLKPTKTSPNDFIINL